MSQGRLVAWGALVALLTAINFAGNLAGSSDRSDNALYSWATAIGGTAQFLVMLGILAAIARGYSLREAFALRQPTSWGSAGGIAVVVLVGVFVLGAALHPFLDPSREQGLVPTRWQPQHADAFAANAVVVTLLAPVVEELTFRGLGYTLLRRFGRPVASLLVGVTFGLVHGLVQGLPLLVAFGIGLAYLRARTASVYPPILVHAAFNGLVLAVALA
jgi:membrane protease YdiL (CAAX protease family)